jgi:DNA-binding MarR family transcriptional regulator
MKLNISYKANKTSWIDIMFEDELINHILEGSGELYRRLGFQFPASWLSGDITVPQLRVMLHLYSVGPDSMGNVARHLGVSLPTATGIVDKLVSREMVVREVGSADRRLVFIRLSPTGSRLVSELWVSGRANLGKLVKTLDREQLLLASRLVDILLEKTGTLAENPVSGDGEGGRG